MVNSVKEGDAIRKNPGNSRIALKQYRQPIAAEVFVPLNISNQ